MTSRLRIGRSIQLGAGISTALLMLAGHVPDALARPAYVRSDVGAPWGSTANEEAMDLAFGAGNWDDLRYETVNVSELFSGTYHVIYLEGSDTNASELEAFLGNYQYTVEQWVSAGGSLLLNAAPNEGVNQSWGFGGVTMNYPGGYSNGAASNVAHPIWAGPNLPAATNFTGGGYAHASITGGVLTAVVTDVDSAATIVAETGWGSGYAMFGGMTTSNFWNPQPDALNIRANMLVYLAEGGGADLDGDGIGAWDDNCPAIANGGQEDTDANGTGDVCEVPAAAYVRSEGGGRPWGSSSNEWAMHAVFGPDAWDNLRFETVDANALFSASYGFVYLDGSDSGADELATFLAANQTAIEDWVDAGGGLFLNSAPNEGASQTWGFGGVMLNYPMTSSGSDGSATDPTHPIWNGPHLPVSTAFSGSGYAHASVSGGGVMALVTDGEKANPTLAELTWGNGIVVFGGLTTDNFWSPQPDSHNLRRNIIYYVAGGGLVDADSDGVGDDVDNCPEDANAGQEDGDGDGVGDACDTCPADPSDDADGDGVCGDVDNCIDDENPDQEDADGDDVGDVCDACPGDADDDADEDGVCGDEDNCPADANEDQADEDGDGMGDVCDDGTSGTSEGGTEADSSGSASDSVSATGLTGTGGTEDTSGGGSEDTGVRGDGDGGGCGCNTEPSPSAWWLGLVVLGLRRRRRSA